VKDQIQFDNTFKTYVEGKGLCVKLEVGEKQPPTWNKINFYSQIISSLVKISILSKRHTRGLHVLLLTYRCTKWYVRFLSFGNSSDKSISFTLTPTKSSKSYTFSHA